MRLAAVLRDVVVEALRALHLGDDHGARALGEDVAREEDQHLVAPEDVAVVVDEADAVGVAVEGDPEVGAVLLHGVDQDLHVLFDRRVGMVIREAAVRLRKDVAHVAAQRRNDARRDRTGGAVPGVDHHLELPRQRPELRDQLRPGRAG